MNTDDKRELKIDSLLAVTLTLAPFGYENLNFPHSKAVGLVSWAFCVPLGFRIIWIIWTVFGKRNERNI